MECLDVLSCTSLGDNKQIDKLLEYEDLVRSIARQTHKSIEYVLKRAEALSPHALHELAVRAACEEFCEFYETLSRRQKLEIFGEYFQPTKNGDD